MAGDYQRPCLGLWTLCTILLYIHRCACETEQAHQLIKVDSTRGVEALGHALVAEVCSDLHFAIFNLRQNMENFKAQMSGEYELGLEPDIFNHGPFLMITDIDIKCDPGVIPRFSDATKYLLTWAAYIAETAESLAETLAEITTDKTALSGELKYIDQSIAKLYNELEHLPVGMMDTLCGDMFDSLDETPVADMFITREM